MGMKISGRRWIMIYLTGDTHNDFSKLSNKSLKKHDLKLTEDDYIIVAGDFGLC